MSAAVDISTWGDFYPDVCSFDEKVTLRNDRNEAKPTWQPIPALQNVPCAIRFLSGDEALSAAVMAPEASHTIKLQGSFPQVFPQMRARVTRQNGLETAYDVLAVADTSGHSRTKLIAKTSV